MNVAAVSSLFNIFWEKIKQNTMSYASSNKGPYFSDCVSKPCGCVCQPTCPKPCDDCFTAVDAIVVPLNSVGPCGKTGFVDLAALNADVKCGGPKEFILLPLTTDAFSKVWIQDNKLFYTTAGVDKAIPNCFFQLNYKMTCKASGLASLGCITVGIKDLCACTYCDTGCDPCTGKCIEPVVDLAVTVLPAQSDISVSIERI